MEMIKIKEGLYKLNDSQHLKKNKDSWNIIHHPKKDMGKPFSSDNINWRNLLIGGSWKSFFWIVAGLCILLFIVWSYAHDTEECRKLLENPPVCYCGTGLGDDTEAYDDLLRAIDPEGVAFKDNKIEKT